jgi:hypothetical protein
MANSLKTFLMEQLTDLHDGVVMHLHDRDARDVLGEDLDQLRGTGTGKSLVMLALLDDLLRMTEIVLAGRWNPLDPGFAQFAAPFFQSAAKIFAKKGLWQYAHFQDLTPANAGKLLDFHSSSDWPFGGQHKPTQWSGLNICTNASIQSGNLTTLNGYERLSQTLLASLRERVPLENGVELGQLVDFIADRCEDARDQLQARHPEWQALAGEWAELKALRTELANQQTRLAEREQLICQEWKRFQQERAEFEQIRQQWEERLADQPAQFQALERHPRVDAGVPTRRSG